MKILIITFTTGVNPGTIMQALGVKTAMRRLWPDANIDYLNFPDFKNSGFGVRGKKDGITNTIKQKAYAAYRLMKYIRLRRNNFHYSKRVDLFNYTDEQVAFIRDYDLIVIGSDTILEQAYLIDGKIGLNWMPLPVKKLYFAASASPANFDATEDLKRVAREALYIGLRDELTINYFQNRLEISSDRIVKQPDPSFFLNINNFHLPDRLRNILKIEDKHVLYNFNSNFPLRKELADGLRSIGYKVVTTAYNPYADICFKMVDAFEWAAIFPFMDLVVTERFHDSVFALRNEKPVIAVDWDPLRFSEGGESKTLCILEDYKHKHLHFNLCNSTDVSPIIKMAKDIHDHFDVDTIKTVNNMMQKRINEILTIVKKTVE